MKKFAALLIALTMLLGMTSLTLAEGNVNYKEEVVIALRQQVNTLDPQALSNTVQNQVLKFWHATLVDLNTVTNEIEPDLAESWNWVDNKTLEVKLNANAKFHNGEPVRSSDVLFTVNRGLDGVASKTRMTLFESVEALDDLTVRFNLKAPNVDLLDTLALPTCSILSEKAFQDDPEEGFRIGAGPWILQEFVVNDYLSFTRFDDYHFGPVKTQKLRVRYIPEDSARAIALQTGEIDLCEHVVAIDLPLLEADPNVETVVFDAPTCQYFFFNYQKAEGPTTNKLVRHAIAHAINRDDIILACKDGFGTPGKSFWGINQYGLYEGMEGYPYDVEKAKALLVEAGYPDGFDLTLTVITGERVISAEVIADQLKKIGINVHIDEVDSAGMTSRVSAGDFECGLWGVGFNSLGDDVRRVYYTNGANNRSWYTNPEVDKLIDAAVAEMDDTVRKALYQQIQEIAIDDLPVINLYYENEIFGMAKGLGGIEWGCSTANDMSFVYVVTD